MNFLQLVYNIMSPSYNILRKQICTSCARQEIQKMSRLRVVDNSKLGKSAMMEGRPPKCIQVYNKKGIGKTGDKVLVAIKGQKQKAILLGCKQMQKPMMPRFDSNNIVLVDDNGSPLGNRIHAPIPTMLRKKLAGMSHPKRADYTKILSIATRFV